MASTGKKYQGSPIVPVRFPPELLAEVQDVVKGSVHRRRAEAWDVSSFIRTAVRDKLDHMRRARACYGGRKRPQPPQAQDPPQTPPPA